MESKSMLFWLFVGFEKFRRLILHRRVQTVQLSVIWRYMPIMLVWIVRMFNSSLAQSPASTTQVSNLKTSEAHSFYWNRSRFLDNQFLDGRSQCLIMLLVIKESVNLLLESLLDVLPNLDQVGLHDPQFTESFGRKCSKWSA